MVTFSSAEGGRDRQRVVSGLSRSPRFARFQAFAAASRGRQRQIPYSDQVVCSEGEGEDPVDPGQAAVLGLPHHPDGLQPSEDLFNALTRSLAQVVGLMLSRASVDRAVPGLLCDMRCRIVFSKG